MVQRSTAAFSPSAAGPSAANGLRALNRLRNVMGVAQEELRRIHQRAAAFFGGNFKTP